MKDWQPTPDQKADWETKGYFIERGVLSPEVTTELRGVIKNQVLLPEPDGMPNADPMDPMGDSVDERAARFRKLGNYCVTSPLIWHTAHAGDPILAIARYFLGDNLILKFNSVFVKPARTGSATPWHQDNGLWRDEETEPFNWWMALDPAIRENGCLQFVPGSHRGEIIQHVLYDDSIHGELPRDLVHTTLGESPPEHVELEPGDLVAWHSSTWHFSLPNASEQSRIGIAGVYTNPDIISSRKRGRPDLRWVLKNGEICNAFPPEPYPLDESVQHEPPTPFPKINAV